MRRFFIDSSNIDGSTAIITGSEALHLQKVLRMGVGDKISLFDGKGHIYLAVIEEVSKKSIHATILETKRAIEQEPYLHLGIGLLKGAKMDLIIQKATELGANTISPFISKHCAIHEKSNTRLERWEKIALEACKQCGRPIPPEITPIYDFKAILTDGKKHDKKIIFWEKEQTAGLGECFSTGESLRSVFALIGPEGGFSKDEISRAAAAGFKPVTLGQRTLRAETAVLAAISILQFLLGNLNRST